MNVKGNDNKAGMFVYTTNIISDDNIILWSTKFILYCGQWRQVNNVYVYIIVVNIIIYVFIANIAW